jgi:hypothetical protein
MDKPAPLKLPLRLTGRAQRSAGLRESAPLLGARPPGKRSLGSVTWRGHVTMRARAPATRI